MILNKGAVAPDSDRDLRLFKLRKVGFAMRSRPCQISEVLVPEN